MAVRNHHAIAFRTQRGSESNVCFAIRSHHALFAALPSWVPPR
jgi:hypothetical protein